ncbi:MAG: glutamine-hydrolyzing carbamoyl-phosphate synthase small subunit [Fimbriimonadaceae bacterium]
MDKSLVLEDGLVLTGKPLGYPGGTVGELVFNTGMTGYQEILSDPSYKGQIVTFTYPLIGNYGINDDDFESSRIQASGIVVGEACDRPSNWRSRQTLDELLRSREVVGISGIDTRMLAKHIRSLGVCRAAIVDSSDQAAELFQGFGDYGEIDFVEQVSTRAPHAWGYGGKESIEAPQDDYRFRVVVVDCGLKYNILRRLSSLHCRSIVLPHRTTAEEILGWEPDGVLLSPGPGDPQRLQDLSGTVQALIGRVPIFGICLGNQVLCQAVGGTTYKLPFGHRGSNHPVLDLATNTVTITSQNHGYAVDAASLQGTSAAISQLNVNDGSVEGIHIEAEQAFSIQYHPEAAPGPWDSRSCFQMFVDSMEARQK